MSNEQRPQLRFGRGGPVDDSTAALRIACIVVCLLNPITAFLTLALIIIGRTSFVRRIPSSLIPLIGAVACIGGWAFGWTAMYLGTYRDAGLSLLDALINALRINGPDNAASTPGEVFSAHWQEWALAQIPFAICLALLASGIYLAYRSRFEATWRAASPR